MIPINNSDLAWLVVSDYNQDNNISFADELREDVYNPEVNEWCSINPTNYPNVGGIVGHSENVGCNFMTNSLGYIGGFDCCFDHFGVGGHPYDPN